MSDPLLERDAERAVLSGLVDRLAAGAGAAVLIEGVAGIGKSSLLRALIDDARTRGGIRVLTARGTELELELAFGAVRQLFAPVAALSEAERAPLFAGPAALAAAVLGTRPMAHSDLADPLYALFWLAANLAESGPLVLAIDDVHWLDAESGRFVAYVARRLEGLPVLLAGSARPREPGAMETPLDVFRAQAEIVTPPLLSEAATAELVGAVAASTEAHRVTGGNPFLLAELVRALAGAEPGHSLDELSTRAVAESVLRRVRRIGPQAIALCDAAALFAAGAELADAARVAGLAAEGGLAAAAAAADALIDAQVLIAAGSRLEFMHPLMRAAVYDQLGPFARRQGHAAVAAVLSSRGAPPEQIAAHLLAGEPAGERENVRILRAAAEQAVAAVAPRAAVRYLARAVDEGAAEAAERRELLLELGRWQRIVGDDGARATLERAFAESEGTADRVRAAIELAATAYSHADNALAVRTVEAARDEEASGDERLILDMLQAEALWGDGRFEESIALIDRVPLELPGDTPAQRMALGMAGAVAVLRRLPTETALDMLRRSVGEDGTAPGAVAGLDLGDPLQWMIQAGGLEEAHALAEERMTHARANGDEALYAATQNAIGWIYAQRGALRESEAAYRLGISHPAVSVFMRTHMTLNLVETLIEMGRLAEAEAELDALGADAFSEAGRVVQVRRAQIALWRGDFAAALPVYERDWELNVRVAGGTDPHPGAVWLSVDLVDCLAAVGRRAEALAIATRMTALSEQLGLAHCVAQNGSALARLTGELADHERAVESVAGGPYRWFEARARLEYGSALRRAGKRVQAREQLRLVLDYSEREGVVHFAQRARQELEVSGARLRDTFALSGAQSLTPAETRIARLAADGMSNKDIAQHLFLTVGTVQTTLVRVYRKLDIGRRTEIAAAIADQELWPP